MGKWQKIALKFMKYNNKVLTPKVRYFYPSGYLAPIRINNLTFLPMGIYSSKIEQSMLK